MSGPTSNQFSDEWTEADTEQARVRFSKMDDAALRRSLKACEHMASPAASWGGKPRESYIIQLRLIREEIERRGLA